MYTAESAGGVEKYYMGLAGGMLMGSADQLHYV
jgi:hypothetical protein